jgi:hypothetical protein
VLKSAPVSDEDADLIVGAIERKDQASAFTLKDQAVVKGVPALDEIADVPQADATVQMGMSV